MCQAKLITVSIDVVTAKKTSKVFAVIGFGILLFVDS